MKTMISSSALCLMILLTAGTVSAQITRFIGHWENLDARRGGTTAIDITREGEKVAVQIYTSCIPTPCMWKKTEGVVHAPSVESNLMADAVAISLNIDDGFAQRIVILRVLGDKLQAEIFTRFTDRSNRANYYQTDTFASDAVGASVETESRRSNDSANRATATFGAPGNSAGADNLLTGKTPVSPNAISGGVLNGKAVTLAKPEYPAAARAVRATGAVNVQVTIDESGSILSASAISGHPLLREAAENAARASKFSPTTLEGQPVQVTGIIVYNFVP